MNKEWIGYSLRQAVHIRSHL